MKKYKDNGVYDFSDYAEEITGDALFKINGGAEVENSDKGVAGAKPGDTIKRKNGDVIVLKQIDIDIANEKLGNNGNDGTGNTNGNSGTSNTSTSESTPEVPEEIKQNSDAYAYYMSLQGRAKEEENPDKYKGYNVLGVEEINAKSLQINTPEKCAKKWAEKYLYESIESDKEYGSTIYKTTDINGNLIYKYTDPNMGSSHSCSPSWPSDNLDVVMYIHTHGAESGPDVYDESFSGNDFKYALGFNIYGFFVTPSGVGKSFNYQTGEIREVFDILPNVKPLP